MPHYLLTLQMSVDHATFKIYIHPPYQQRIFLSQRTIGLRKVHLGAVDLAVQKERVRTKDHSRETEKNSQCRGRAAVASHTTGTGFDGSCGPFQLGENGVDVVATVGVGVKVLALGQASLAFCGLLVALFAQLDELVVWLK